MKAQQMKQRKNTKNEVSLLIPAYNEEKHLAGAIAYYHSYLKKQKNIDSFEIIICVNGSTDNTAAVAKQLSKKYREVSYFVTKQKGMGIALKLGILKAKKDIVTYMPGDGEIEANFIGDAIEHMQEYDMIIGSRKMAGTYEGKSMLRKIFSYGFNAVLSILLSSKVAEAASVKMFRRIWGRKAAHELQNHGFEWQVEFVYYALRDNLRLGLAPSRTIGRRILKESSVQPFRLAWRLLKVSFKYGLKYRFGQLF